MNDNPGCFNIEKGIIMLPRGGDNRYIRTAIRMVPGDSVLFPTYNAALKLRLALKKVNKIGAIRKEVCSAGTGDDKVTKDRYRCWCINKSGVEGRR